MLKSNRLTGSGEVSLKVCTTNGRGCHLGHVTKPSCIFFFFHYSQKLSHYIWFQITKQFFRKIKFKFVNGVTFVKSQIMTLAFDIHLASLNHLVQCSYQL